MIRFLAIATVLFCASGALAEESKSPWWFYDWNKSVVVGPFDKEADCNAVNTWTKGSAVGNGSYTSKCWQGSGWPRR